MWYTLTFGEYTGIEDLPEEQLTLLPTVPSRYLGSAQTLTSGWVACLQSGCSCSPVIAQAAWEAGGPRKLIAVRFTWEELVVVTPTVLGNL